MKRKTVLARLSGDSAATFVGFALTCGVLLLSVWLTNRNTHRLADANAEVDHTHRVINGLERLLSTLKDAETGQRGFVITGNPDFLQPYDEAVGRVWGEFEEVQRLTADDPAHQDRLALVRQRVALKLAELKEVIDLRRTDVEAATAVVRTGRGKAEMDTVRKIVAEMQDVEQRLMAERGDRTSRVLRQTVVVDVLTGVVGFFMVGAVFYLVHRNDHLRQRAAEAVAEQKERLRTTLASIGDAVISTDASGNVTYLNIVAESLTGWKNDEAAGVPLTRVFHIVNESTRQPVENPALRALKEGVIVGLANHTTLIARDGTERPIDDSAAPIRSKDGEVVGCVLVFRDISERKREEVAQAERTRLVALRADVSTALASAQPTPDALRQCCEALVRHLGVAFARVWTLDDADAVLELQASAGLYTHLDGPHSRVPVGQFKIGRIASRRQPHLTNAVPDDPEVSDQAWARKAGMVAFAGYPLVVEGRVVGVVAMFASRPLSDGVLTDLAPLAEGVAQYIDRKRGEERSRRQAELHRVTLASIGDAVLTTDAAGAVAYLNAVAQCMTGWTQADAHGKPLASVFNIVNESTRLPVENPVEKVLALGQIVGLANHTILIGKDGTERHIDDSAAPIKDERGRVVGVVLVFHDVSERRRAEAEREKAQREVATTLESITDGFMRFDRDWRVVYVNAEAQRIVRRSRAELIGHTHWELFPATVGTRVEAEYRRAVAERVTVELENYYQPLGGWYAIRGYPTPDDGLVIYFRDVTNAKRAEARLAESERRMRFVMDSMPQKIFTATPGGDVDYFNPIWSQFTGLPFERIRDWGWTQFIHPDDVAENVRVWKHSVDTGEPFQFEHRFRRHDGEYRWHVSRAVPMRDDAGRVVMWIGSNTDIHDVKQAEQTARFVAGVSAALADLTDAVSTLQKVASLTVPSFADWCAVDMLEGGERRRVAVMHADPAKLRAYRGLIEQYPPRTDDPHGIPHVFRTGEPDLVEDIPDALLAAVAHDEEHLRLLRGMGLKSHILVPIRSHGRTLGVLTFITAESGRRYAPADLRVAQDLAHRAAVAVQNADLYRALQDADRRKDEFLATLAHELRNPLAPIRNGLQVMRLSHNREATEKARGMMERQLDQMVRLVDDLMDVSRISRGKLELKRERVPLAAVVNSAVETSRPLIDQMGHDLTVTLPERPVVVDADLTRLAQVFLNLLNNAAKYSDRGGHIRLTAGREGGDVVVSVTDSGIGIAADQLPHIFEMFSQVDRSLEKAQGGLGIGLTLVKQLVEMHGGRVEARSEGTGMGSEFVVRLPVVVEESVSRAVDRDEPQSALRSPLRILVVDDNRDGADSLSDMLGIMGNDTRTAYDGEAAVAAAGEFRPDVILLDLGLPKLNGYEACRRIREQAAGRPLVIIAQTGWGQDEDRQRTHDAGFDHHLVKPVDPATLMGLLAGLPTAGTA